jgi:hypothetical protein
MSAFLFFLPFHPFFLFPHLYFLLSFCFVSYCFLSFVLFLCSLLYLFLSFFSSHCLFHPIMLVQEPLNQTRIVASLRSLSSVSLFSLLHFFKYITNGYYVIDEQMNCSWAYVRSKRHYSEECLPDRRP